MVDDCEAVNRYNAACAAELTAGGKGRDAPEDARALARSRGSDYAPVTVQSTQGGTQVSTGGCLLGMGMGKTKQPSRSISGLRWIGWVEILGMGRAGIEPATPGFSVLCSTS